MAPKSEWSSKAVLCWRACSTTCATAHRNSRQDRSRSYKCGIKIGTTANAVDTHELIDHAGIDMLSKQSSSPVIPILISKAAHNVRATRADDACGDARFGRQCVQHMKSRWNVMPCHKGV